MSKDKTIKELVGALIDPASYVKKHIEDNNLTAMSVAQGSGVPLKTIRAFICGYRPNTGLATMNKLTKFVLVDKGLVQHKVGK